MNAKREHGQIMVLVALGVVVLLGFTALAVDMGMAYADRRQAQNAADAAALAGARAKLAGQDVGSAALAQAQSYGYSGGNVTVNYPPQKGCSGATSAYAGNDQYVQIVVRSTQKTGFGPILGVGETSNCVEATARATPPQWHNLFGPYALVALKPNGKGTMDLNGNVDIKTNGGGVFVNSSGTNALTASGNLTLDAYGGIISVGGVDINGNVTIKSDITSGGKIQLTGNIDHRNVTLTEYASVPAMPYPPEINIPAPSAPTASPASCTGTGQKIDRGSYWEITPGSFQDGLAITTNNKSVVMQPGNYCFGDDFTVNGNFALTADNVSISMQSGGKKQKPSIDLSGNLRFTAANSLFYLSSGSFTVDGNANVSLSGSTTYLASGAFAVLGNSAVSLSGSTTYLGSGSLSIDGNSGIDLTNSTLYLGTGDLNINGNDKPTIRSVSPSVVYLGTGDLAFNGNSKFTSSETLFYLNGGSLKWNGNTEIKMSAPTSGTYKGLLIYMPVDNQGKLVINGNASSHTTGTILVPGAEVVLNGNSSTSAFESQIVGYTMNINGNANTTVNYAEGENYGETTGPSIDLIQ